jgi:hypothetical protein
MQCSFCYEDGHNKMGCPKAKEIAANALPQWEAWQKMNQDDIRVRNSIWRAGRHFDWCYQTKEAMEIWEKKQKRSRTTKVCNFCGESGHNKRTCSALIETRKNLVLAERGFRNAVVTGLKQTGQGIGAVISGEREFWCRKTNDWVKDNSIGLVVGHRWDLLHLCQDRQHGELSISTTVGSNFLQVRWNDGVVEYKPSVVTVNCGKFPLFYRGWQTAKLKVISKSDKLSPPAAYADLSSVNGFLKGRKAQNASQLHWYFEEKLPHFIKIGQKMSSTS